MALPATDNFNRGDSSDLGTNWDVIYGAGHQIASNACACNTGSEDGWDGAEVWNADSFDDDHYSSATVSTAPGAGGATGLAVRCDPTPDDYFYGYSSDNANAYLFKVVNGSFTTHDSGTAWTNGNTIRLEAEGTSITALKNGSNDTSVSSPWTDSSISSGSAGVSGYGAYSPTFNSIDNWEGVNLGAAEPSPNVSDDISVSESVTALISALIANIQDDITTTDSITPEMIRTIVTQDDVVISDSTAIALLRALSVQDSTVATDSITIAVSDSQIDRQDDVTVTDSVTTDILINITAQDNATATDSVTVSVQAIGAVDVNVSDDATATDLIVGYILLETSVQDDITVTESVTVVIEEESIRYVIELDNITIGESVSIVTSDPQIVIQDNITVSDSATVNIQETEVPALDIRLARYIEIVPA